MEIGDEALAWSALLFLYKFFRRFLFRAENSAYIALLAQRKSAAIGTAAGSRGRTIPFASSASWLPQGGEGERGHRVLISGASLEFSANSNFCAAAIMLGQLIIHGVTAAPERAYCSRRISRPRTRRRFMLPHPGTAYVRGSSRGQRDSPDRTLETAV